MKRSLSLFTVLVSASLFSLAGCAGEVGNEPVDSDESSITSGASGSVVGTDPSTAALAFDRATWHLTGTETYGVFVYWGSANSPMSSISGNNDGLYQHQQVVVGQIIDSTNDGDEHVFGVYDMANTPVGKREGPEARVGTVKLGAKSVTGFQLLRKGKYRLVCEDCIGPVVDFDKGLAHSMDPENNPKPELEGYAPVRPWTIVEVTDTLRPCPYSVYAHSCPAPRPAPDLL